MKKYLTLENGQVFIGRACGDLSAERTGELVFTTNMTGYQETLTDPSYTNQLVMFTYPLIGNYGLDAHANQSNQVAASAVILQELAPNLSAQLGVNELLVQNHVPGIAEIDTRQLTKIVRSAKGAVRAKLTNYPVESSPGQWGVTESYPATNPSTLSNESPKVVLIDFGTKQDIINSLTNLGAVVVVVPPTTSFAEIQALNSDGILLSNGPGNPEDYQTVLPLIHQLTQTYPLQEIRWQSIHCSV
ncbi:carbamoyl-phosphate synthase small subunit [Secundilactobacillus oryzae JCM 18671]|uniref:Carbamoyl-phosphate synthase small subunit n=1 Tax=Secundilactobacillus oryzae JCM 18671 TaxID=1291743 RepID=A0A081BJ67_9LACO|nr:carbamoyl phosphate synthase small subunit [Secundilactobacillus oryzae]GAK48085.1 carbamoyl-phosphate synthase small subunit [Secundilactobacillus oryzae JCM 18671]